MQPLPAVPFDELSSSWNAASRSASGMSSKTRFEMISNFGFVLLGTQLKVNHLAQYNYSLTRCGLVNCDPCIPGSRQRRGSQPSAASRVGNLGSATRRHAG